MSLRGRDAVARLASRTGQSGRRTGQDCQKKSGNSTTHETSRTKFILVRDETHPHSISL